MRLVRKNSIWALKPLSFIEPACNQFYNDGRLVLVQGYRGSGQLSFLVYGVYGHANTRWDVDKKKQFHLMLDAICKDLVARGPQPACIVGDYNLQ